MPSSYAIHLNQSPLLEIQNCLNRALITSPFSHAHGTGLKLPESDCSRPSEKLKSTSLNPLMFFEPSNESQQTETEDFPADPRVSSALDELDIPCHFNPATGRFEVLVQLENGRSQTVFIYSRTDDLMGFELREISSAAMVSDGPFDSRTTNLLMRVNAELVHGKWCIHIGEDATKHFAVFTMTALAFITAEPLWSIIECVAQIADEMEERLSGLDEF